MSDADASLQFRIDDMPEDGLTPEVKGAIEAWGLLTLSKRGGRALTRENSAILWIHDSQSRTAALRIDATTTAME